MGEQGEGGMGVGDVELGAVSYKTLTSEEDKMGAKLSVGLSLK